MVVGDAEVEFADDFWINELSGHSFKDHEPILDRDDPAHGRQVVAVQWIASSLPFGRPRFRLRFLLGALSLIGAASALLRLVPACCFLDFRPSIFEILKRLKGNVP